MKLFSLIATGMLAVSLTFASLNADAAKRMGGGKSMGKQSSNVTQQTAPTASPGAGAAAAPAAAGAAAAATKKPWGMMLGGLAAGLGLAWLASSLGMGEALGQMLMFGLLALAIMVAVGWFMRRRAANQGGKQQNSPYAMAGINSGATHAPVQRSYSPENVGNDASARPWERNSTAFQAQGSAAGGSVIGSRLSGGSSNWTVPADFDVPAFLTTAKQAFIALQAAWDKNDVSTLGTMMTDEMLREIRQQLSERDQHTGGSVNHTEVAALDAKLLGIEDTGKDWMASVEFSGMIKEDPSQSPGPFREVWNMTKPKDGSAGWLVAGLQAMN
jgi:predicted lipid-binding transport protein (Tim44 family)